MGTKNITIEDEILENAARNYDKNQLLHFIESNDKTAFKSGARWQKEKDKIVIDKLAEALSSMLKTIQQELNIGSDKQLYNVFQEYQAARELLNSIKL